MTNSMLFSCCCAIIVCLALMAQDKSVLAISNDDSVQQRFARYFEGGQLMRVKRACGADRCSQSRQCGACCRCVDGCIDVCVASVPRGNAEMKEFGIQVTFKIKTSLIDSLLDPIFC
uniref:WAP domain-containing protein n=1 Tax=Globodera pallida TaxID=36090 RepID=A0A183CB82_GLOPA